MNRYVDAVLDSMVSHDAGALPLSARYAATENGQPAALWLMTCWRTVTGVNHVSQVIEDQPAGSIVFTANLDESGSATILFGRLKVDQEQLTEIELYVDRSRCDSGFVYLPDQMDKLPEVWTRPLPPTGRASRQELVELGRALFDVTDAKDYPATEDCLLLEIGGIVYEDSKYLSALRGEPVPTESSLAPIGGGLWPGRPVDPDEGEVLAADEEQGVVVSRLNVDGYVCPYVVDNENSSCFVPAMMLEDHMRTLEIADLDGKPVLRQMPATATTFEMVRFFDGAIQGMHRYINLQATGGRSPWAGAHRRPA